jgi:hypothetical protein
MDSGRSVAQALLPHPGEADTLHCSKAIRIYIFRFSIPHPGLIRILNQACTSQKLTSQKLTSQKLTMQFVSWPKLMCLWLMFPINFMVEVVGSLPESVSGAGPLGCRNEPAPNSARTA